MKQIIRHICILLFIILSASVNQGCGSIPTPTNSESDKNKSLFYESANTQGIDSEETDAYFRTVMEDNIFEDGAMELTGLIIDDIDKNGQNDMLVMVLDAAEKPFYGSGCLWIYMNNDKPYRFDKEYYSYYGLSFDAFGADIDNDENIEIVSGTQGCGCGAVGDSYKAIFKYKNNGSGGYIEEMELPSDLDEYYDSGLNIIVSQHPEKDCYSAYCPYTDEAIAFQSSNELEPPYSTHIVGGNVRGFFNLKCVEYEGRNALQASEYLNGENGIAHCVAVAQFLIVWDDNGMPNIAKWWIEVKDNPSDENSDAGMVYTDTSATAQLYG